MQFRTGQSTLATGLICAGLLFARSTSAQQAPWPQFRGPQANPVAENRQLPVSWSATENVEWSADIPGRGWSSPIVAGNKVFLTTVTTEGKSKPPQVGTEYSNEYVAELMKQGLSEEEVEKKVTERDIELPNEVSLHYFLYCLDIESGKELWKQEFYAGNPPTGRHRKNSFSSETPVTDGKHVFVYVANLGLYAYDLEGNRVWTQKMESHPIYFEFGTGSSPVLSDNQLMIVHDNEEHSFIAAYDPADGNLIWQTDRIPLEEATADMPKSGWATPFVWKHKLRTEIITVSPGVAISYDVDGKELWRMKGMSMGPAASSFVADGLLYLDGGKAKPMFAILPGATGDISLDADTLKSEFVAWSRPRAGTYIPTPVVYQGGLYIVHDNGIISRFDAKTGEESFKERIKSTGADFTSSPWAYNGYVFCLSEQGDTYVYQAGKEHKLLHVNSLGDMCMATAAIVDDRLMIRTEKHLYSIRKKN